MTVAQRNGHPVLALLIGLASGMTAYFIGMPLPWMLGSMIGVTIAAMSGAPIKAPARMRPYVIPVIGVMLGSGMTAKVFDVLGQWALTLAVLPLVLIISFTASYAVYRRVGGYDPTTAFYSSMPGGLNEMLVLGGAAGGDERKIALAHAARVLLVIFLVALIFGIFFGVQTGPGGVWTRLDALSVTDYGLLIACAVIGVPLAKLVRFPAPALFGPMILSGAIHILGWTHVAPPSVVIIGAQVVVGTIIGCRFIGATVKEVGRDLALTAGITVIALVATALFAVAVARTIDMPMAQAFLAFAPGGVTEMSLMTLAIGQDVAFVSVAHLIRITLVIAIAPPMFSLFARLTGLAKGRKVD